MKGLGVFNFSLKKVTPNVEELLLKAAITSSQIDFFVFHQANQLILEAISKKLAIDLNKVPSSLKEFGNTSCATIPLTLVTNFSSPSCVSKSRMVLCGFGVGFSWGSVLLKTKHIYTNLVEHD